MMRPLLSFVVALVMIGSSFTPFAYAQSPQEIVAPPANSKTLNLLTKVQNGGGTCNDDVYLDNLDWNEYKNLRDKTIKTVDGFGNQALGVQEKNANSAGAGTNGDVTDAKNYYIPGVNGKPAILYDVMKNKVVDPTDTCHLNNFFSTGRIAYATRLVDNLRYCGLNDTNCEAGVPSSQRISTIQAKINVLKGIQGIYNTPGLSDVVLATAKQQLIDSLNADPEIKKAFQSAGVDPAQIQTSDDLKAAIQTGLPAAISYLTTLLKTVPSSFVESQSAELTLSNADFLDLLPATRADFFDFMQGQKQVDQYLLLLNLASVGTAWKGSGKSFKEFLSGRLKGGTRPGIRTALEEGVDATAAWNKVGKSATTDALSAALKEGKPSKELDTLVGNYNGYIFGTKKAVEKSIHNGDFPATDRIRRIDSIDQKFTLDAGKTLPVRRTFKVDVNGAEQEFSINRAFTPDPSLANDQISLKDLVALDPNSGFDPANPALLKYKQDVVTDIKAKDPLWNPDPTKVDTRAAVGDYTSKWGSVTSHQAVAGAPGVKPRGPIAPPRYIGKADDAFVAAEKVQTDITKATTVTPAGNQYYTAFLGKALNDGGDFEEAALATKPNLRDFGRQVLNDIKSNKANGVKFGTAKALSQSAGAILNNVLTRGIFAYTLNAFQTTNFITAAAIWINNDRVITPSYSIQEATFNLGRDPITGSDLQNLARVNNKDHYLEIDKTGGNTNLQKYADSVLLQIFEAAGLSPKNSPIRDKLKNIQDLVFIYDQDAFALGLNSRATNVVSSPYKSSTGVNLWSFLSNFNDYSLTYTYEHPNGFLTSKKSALYLDINNVNIGGILAKADNNFNTPLTGLISFGRFGRDLLKTASLFAIFPSIGSFIGGGIGAGGSSIIGLVIGAGPGKDIALGPLYDVATGGYGKLVDIAEIYKQKSIYCDSIFGQKEKDNINSMKAAIGVTSASSAILGLAKVTPLVAVSFAVDILNMYLTYAESEMEQKIAEGLSQCVDTSFKGIAYKEFVPQKEVQDSFQKVFEPIKADAFNVLGSLAPEVSGQINNVAKSLSQQVLNINGDISNNLVSANGKEVYYVNLKDADIKWFQSPTCSIDICQYDNTKQGYVCNTQKGYFLYDQDGKPILNGIPQALSATFDIPNGDYAFVQNVVEIKKRETNSDFLQIKPTGVSLAAGQTCGASNILGLLGITSTDQSAQNLGVKEAFGNLQGVYTKDAQIWFDKNDAVVQFTNAKTCEDGTAHGEREVARYSGGYLNFKRDSNGKVEVKNADNSVACSFNLGTDGAISFDNALLRSGQPSGANSTDYSSLYHLFIYNLLKFDKGDLTSFGFGGICTDNTGANAGVNLDVSLSTEKNSQAKQALKNICFTNFQGPNNETIQFKDGNACIKDASGTEACHQIDHYNPSTGRLVFTDGFELAPAIGPDGVPQFQQYKNGRASGSPIPLYLGNGLGGSFQYNPGTGQISINNQFQMPINPNFGFYGAGGTAFMTPQPQPWGQKPQPGAGGAGVPTPQPNLLAQLPWTPSGGELIIFLIALLGSLLLVRIRYRRQ